MSGTEYSCAEMRYCAGRSRRMTENIPMLTEMRFVPPSPKPSGKRPATSSGSAVPSPVV